MWVSREVGARMVKPAGALLGVVPWKGNRREQEQGWTLRRKRLEEGREVRAKTCSHAAVAGSGGSGAPRVAATGVRREDTAWAGSPASCPQAPLQPRLAPPFPASCFWTPFPDAYCGSQHATYCVILDNLLFTFLAVSRGMQYLSPPTRDGTHGPCSGSRVLTTGWPGNTPGNLLNLSVPHYPHALL